ncbi:MAG: CofH family radical SAM protein [Desulfobacterales bacterium]|nr:CofH family radical SAM protein [Desulfobacterales bacterium]
MNLQQKIYKGQRITKNEALELFNFDIIELGELADICRKKIYPDEHVGFIINRIINFTNVCDAQCNFCAYHARAGIIDPYELSIDDILNKVNELVDIGGNQVMLQGGLHPDYTLDNYIKIVKEIKKRYPKIFLHSFSPAELIHISKKNNLALNEVISSLKKAGLDSVPGASDLLVDNIRKKVSPKKLTKDEWVSVIETLHRNEMKSSATMTYGMGETILDRIEHLNIIREVQDKTGIIRAFIPWSFSPRNTQMNNIIPATGVEYLKIVSVSRIFLDNIIYIQAGWLTEGLKLAQIALSLGANDMGGVLMEETVVKATGIKINTNKNELCDIIKNAGKIPVQRDSEYKIISLE